MCDRCNCTFPYFRYFSGHCEFLLWSFQRHPPVGGRLSDARILCQLSGVFHCYVLIIMSNIYRFVDQFLKILKIGRPLCVMLMLIVVKCNSRLTVESSSSRLHRLQLFRWKSLRFSPLSEWNSGRLETTVSFISFNFVVNI